MPCARQAASTSSESVATRRAVRSGDRRARAYTWQSIGRPAMSRSTFRGSRVDWSRAGMTPRTASPAAISGLDGVPGAPSRGRQEAQVVDDADERPALGQAPVGILGRAAVDAGHHAGAPGRGEQPLHHRLELGILRLEGRREPGRGAEVARPRVAGVEAGDGENVVDPADGVDVLDLGHDQDLVVGAAEVGEGVGPDGERMAAAAEAPDPGRRYLAAATISSTSSRDRPSGATKPHAPASGTHSMAPLVISGIRASGAIG